MLTDEQIKAAIDEMGIYFGANEPYDHIRMAYEWLDAQEKTDKLIPLSRSFGDDLPRYMCQDWCGWFMCENTFDIAAYLHPEIKGKHPRFNISDQFILPKLERIEGLKGILANDESFGKKHSMQYYKRLEQ